ncbi:MAG: carboxypeptidase regulatory-like domain-containing protein, partial [Gemmatimonadota bacterium]|nr:carboxypeptidase regulatory-like domain-containing protein [Gemmatimonadota bacterium]
SDSTNPVNLGSAFNDPTGAVHASWPVGDGVHVLIAEETTGGHVKALDVSNPSAITQVGVHNPAPSASIHNIHVEGDLAYAAWYARGVRVLDVSDPSNLTEVGYWDTFPETDAGGVGPGNWGVYPHLPSGVIAANDRTYGMFLLRYDPTAGVMDGTVSSSDGGPAPGATVEFAELNFTDTTDATGTYTISSFAGAGKQLVFGGFGFSPDTMVVTVPPGGTVTTDVTLVKLPWGGVSGRVTNAGTGLGIEAAEVSLLGTPLLTETDAAGDYSFPDVPEGAYAVEARRYGFVPSTGLSTTIVAGSVASLDATLEPAPVFEDFSVASGWTVQNDAATTTGFWVFEEPFGTYQSGVPFQTETDHTLDPENKCAVTGNEATGSLGADDVDGGATKLLSPAYDLSAMTEPHVFYYRWYAVNAEEDEWTVELTLDGGASWALLESTPLMEAYWKPVDIDLTAFVSGPGAGSVQFRFTALDPDPGQLVEAALDDFTIYDASSSTGIPDLPPAPAMVPGLAQNAPNPFADETTVRFSVAREGPVELSVFDVRGARVAVLADGDFAAGSHEASWDGRSTGGRRAASGVYYYRLTTPGFVTTKSLVLLK